jgi:hypothetical protein
MEMKRRVVALLMMLCGLACTAQTAADGDSIFVISSDSALLRDLAPVDTAVAMPPPLLPLPADSTVSLGRKPKRDWTTWTPDPKRALWLALVIPGGGQIYNRKYWKLPIVYGGFMGCIYALTWNDMMYKDYSQAYLDISDDDPGTASYNKFLHLGRQINDQNKQRYTEIFKSRKNRYRRYRDLSFFVMVGIYALSVIDAYVDAELSVFDISKDLSLKVQPAVMGNPLRENSIYASSVGVNCSLNF